MSFEAQCHCGAVSLTIDAELPTEAITCNCSHCSIKALVLAAVPGEAVTVAAGDDQLQTYRFNRKVIDHRFCRTCGVEPYARGKGADGAESAMINLRCVRGLDLSTLKLTEYDGASH